MSGVHETELADDVRFFALRFFPILANQFGEGPFYSRIMVSGHQVGLGHGQRFVTQSSRINTVHDEVVRVTAFDEGGDLSSPRGGRREFVPGFPAQDGFVIAVAHAGEGVGPVQDERDGLFEIGDDLRIRPECVLRFAAKPGVFGPAAHPAPVVHERDDQPDAGGVGRLQNFIERTKRLLVETARPQDMTRGSGRVVGPEH